MRVAFVTNFCPHYRVKTFETLARYYKVDYYFFSAGDEWYWQQQHGVRGGNFHYKYLPGFLLGRTRITPTLPYLLWQSNYDVYVKCISGRFALPITYLVARTKRRPFILWTGVWMRLRSPFHRLFFPVTRYIYRHADAVVVYGEHVKRYLVSEGVGSEKIFVAPHAVDNDFYGQSVSEADKMAMFQKLGIDPKQKVVLYLGRLEAEKGLSYLVDAFATVKENSAVLVLAGEGRERAHLERMVSEKGLTRHVIFAGYVPVDQTLPFYAISWVSVLPSVTTSTSKEPWGLVVNEAFNQGVPVIVTDAVGAAAGGLVKDGINGFIVPERNANALAHALRKVLSDPALREQLSKNAVSSITNWDNERMVMGFRQAIQYVVMKKRD